MGQVAPARREGHKLEEVEGVLGGASFGIGGQGSAHGTVKSVDTGPPPRRPVDK